MQLDRSFGKTGTVSVPAFFVQNYSFVRKSGREKIYYLSYGKNAVYNQHYGFCLETQQFPDSMNNEGFPRGVLHPNEIYSAKTVYKFGW